MTAVAWGARTPEQRADWHARYQRELEARRARDKARAERVAADEAAVDDCVLRTVPGPWDRRAKLCYLCAAPIPKGMRRWCSSAHADTWWENHAWNFARYRALLRDGNRCTACGAAESTGMCRQCSGPWPCTQHPYHGERTVPMEVDHIEARNGEGYHVGCHHHAENLRTLCHPCHVRRTTVANAVRRCFERSNRLQLVARIGVPAAPKPPVQQTLWMFPEGWRVPGG